jgi:hypothetical protein
MEVEKLLFIRNFGGGMTSKRLSPTSAFDNVEMADDWVNGKLALNGSLSPPSVANAEDSQSLEFLFALFRILVHKFIKFVDITMLDGEATVAY